MTIDWQNEGLYNGKTPLPRKKKINVYDIAAGSGILNLELGYTQHHFIQYMVQRKILSKSQEKSVREKFQPNPLLTTGDALSSTFGPLFEKMKSIGPEFKKDTKNIELILTTRNTYTHEFVNKSVRNEDIDLERGVKALIDAINTARSLNNRYRNLLENPPKSRNKGCTNQPSKDKEKPRQTKLTDKQLKPIVEKAIAEVSDSDGMFYMAALGKELQEQGIEKNMYAGKLSELCKRLNLVRN